MNQGSIDRLTTPGWHHIAENLYFRISPKGARVFLFRFASRRTGKNQWISLGDVRLKKAKAKAHTMRQALIEGRDPLSDKQAAEAERRKIVPTFAECTARFLATNRDTWKNAKHAAQWDSTLATHAAPLGRMPVADIEAKHVAAVLKPIWMTKTETATRVRGRIERVLNWAVAQGYRTAAQGNAAALDVLRHLLPSGKRAAVKHHEALPWRDVPGLCQELTGSTSARALLFTILTAARTGETIGATFGEIDMQAALWTIPAGRMKAGKIHRIPLAPAVLELLAKLTRSSGSYVFPGGKPGKPLSNMAMLELLRGLRGMGATVHGLRSSFRDWCADTNAAPREVCEAALAHAVKDKTEAAYLRTDHLDARRPLMIAWANHCLGTQPPKERSAAEEALAGMDRRARRPGRLRIF